LIVLRQIPHELSLLLFPPSTNWMSVSYLSFPYVFPTIGKLFLCLFSFFKCNI
jgi:hypothetical protein